jgi:membrane associated rhomboid family serine protease
MPDPLQHIAKLFIAFGIIFTVLGALLLLFRNSGIPFLGKLPGDIVIQRKNFAFYFPVATSILLSIILSVIFYFISRK